MIPLKTKALSKANIERPDRRSDDPRMKRNRPFIDYTGARFLVLGVPFGGPVAGRDATGEAFTPETDIWLAEGDNVPVTYYHGLGPDDPDFWQESPAIIGKAAYLGVDEAGHWFEVRLDPEEPLAARLTVEGATVRASSGAVGHLVRMGDAGLIDVWPVGELALFDTNDWRLPANDFATAERIKSDEEVAAKVGSKMDGASIKGLAAATETEDESYPNTNLSNGDSEMETKTEDVQRAALTEEDVKSIIAGLQPAVVDAVRSLWNDPAFEAPAIKSTVRAPEASKMTDAEREAARVKAFEAYIRNGDRESYKAAVKAALEEGTPAEGGILVPDKYSNELIVALSEASVLRAAGARVLRVSGTDSFRVPTLSGTSAAVLTDEEGQFDEEEPTFGEVVFTPYKYTRLSKASDEVLADTRIPLESILIPDVEIAFAAAENTAFAVGGGTAAPQGLTVGASVGVTATADDAITSDELIDLYHSLPTFYRSRASFVMNDNTAKYLRKLKNSTTDEYLWQPALQAGQPDRLLGRPVVILSTMPDIEASERPIVFADLSYFWIVDFAGLEMKRLNELYAENGQVGFRWYKRFDSNVMLSAAVKALVMDDGA